MKEKINTVFLAQQENRFNLRKTDAKVRIAKLTILKKVLQSFENELYQALQEDLRKSRFETAVTELFFTYAEIDFAIKNLKKWMREKSVSRTLSNLFARNRIKYEAKGVCLLIAPWNYPLQLVMSPLVSAIAAGNCVIVKPSELSSSTSAILSKMLSECFETDEVACFEGGEDVSMALLALPFDHIFFTGSTAIGKKVMEAAARNLTSITLELGGKSPVIVDDTVDLKKAAEKIAWGKFVNAGQTCIAPDYLLIDKKLEKEFVLHFRNAAEKMFFKNSAINENEYGKIINNKHFQRLADLVTAAIKDGAKLEMGGKNNEKELTFMPTIFTAVTAENALMKDELFGPILPIISFNKLQEAINFVNSKDKPLALYIFSESKVNQKKIILETSSGGVCVNDVLVHISNPNLPFGGVNTSGIGSSHGFYGFKNFSHERAFVFQSKFYFTNYIYPPYEEKIKLLKWLKKLM